MTNFVFASELFVQVVLMDYEMVGEDIVRNSSQIHFEKTGGFVTAVAYKSFVTPDMRIVADTRWWFND